MAAEEIEAIASELAALSERLGDVALDLLHQALSTADPKASPEAKQERILTRARRSIDKAVGLLAATERDEDAEA